MKHIKQVTTPAPADLRCSIAAILAGKSADDGGEYGFIMQDKGCSE